jgi:hypothetical protein
MREIMLAASTTLIVLFYRADRTSDISSSSYLLSLGTDTQLALTHYTSKRSRIVMYQSY